MAFMVLRSSLDEGSDPFHERLSDKRIFPPAIEIDKPAHLPSGNQRQQLETVRQANVLDRKKDFFKGRVTHHMRGIGPGEEFIQLLSVLNPQCRTDQRTEHLIRHMTEL